MRPHDYQGPNIARGTDEEQARDLAGFLARVKAGRRIQGPVRRQLLGKGLMTEGRYRDWLTPAGRALLEKHPVREMPILDAMGPELTFVAYEQHKRMTVYRSGP